jgi:hypothetical protein
MNSAFSFQRFVMRVMSCHINGMVGLILQLASDFFHNDSTDPECLTLLDKLPHSPYSPSSSHWRSLIMQPIRTSTSQVHETLSVIETDDVKSAAVDAALAWLMSVPRKTRVIPTPDSTENPGRFY